MKKNLVIIIALFLSACSTTLPLNYVPSASIRGNAQVTVGKTRYIPYELGEVDENQFQEASAATGDVYLSEPVPKLLKTALRKELIAGGFFVEPNSKLIIEADVTKFLYDWVGFTEVDFYLNVDFKILKNKQTILSYRATAHQKAPKTMMQDTEAIRAAISRCIDDFFMEAHAKKIL